MRRPSLRRRSPRNIVLVGLSGSGKSSVGRRVARRLGWAFVDTDAEIIARSGKSITEIFSQDGETAFRQLEKEVVLSTLSGHKRVVATGGGAVLDGDSLAAMAAEDNLMVWLHGSAEHLAKRVSKGHNVGLRPLLAAGDPVQTLQRLEQERRQYYQRAAASVDTSGREIDQVADLVWEIIRGFDR